MKGQDSSGTKSKSFSFHVEEYTDDDTSSPDSRFIYTRKRTSSTKDKTPATERTLQSPEQVSRQVHSQRIQTRKPQQLQHSSPTSVFAEVQRRIFRPRDDEYHDDEDDDELDNLANGMMQVCSLDGLDTSSIDTPSYRRHHHHATTKHPSDEPEVTESKYSRAIRYLASQDATILSLKEELQQAQQEILDLKASKENQTTAILSLQTQLATTRQELQSAQNEMASKEHQTTAIHSLQNQLATTRKELQAVQAEMARRSQAHETASAQTFREQIAAEDARQREMQKTREAQRESDLLKRQVMELEAEVNRWRPQTARSSPPVIPTLFNPMDTSIDSVSSASLPDKQVETQETTTPKDEEPTEPEAAPRAVLAPPPPTIPKAAPAVEMDRASSCVTEIIANTTSRIQSSAATTSAAAAAPNDVQSEIDELRAALTARAGGAYPHLSAPRKQQPAREQLLDVSPPVVEEEPEEEEDTESSLRNQLRIVRGEPPLPSAVKPSSGNTGQATSEGALLSDVSSDEDDVAGPTGRRRRDGQHGSMTQLEDAATMETVDLMDRETASLGGARWHAVGDEEVKGLLKELQLMKETVTSAQAPERPARSTNKDRFAFSNIVIPNRNSGRRGAHPDATGGDEGVVDSLRRRLGGR